MKKTIAVFALVITFLLSNTFALATSAVQAKGTGTAKFTDMNRHWAEAAVQKLAEKGALPFNEDQFIPDKAVTRSEFVMMLHKALNIQIMYLKAPDINDYFTGVKQDAPYASALIDLVTANIIESGGIFKPGDTLTREEMIHYVMNAYKYKMGDRYRQIKINPPSFKDSDKINLVYSGDVARAAHYKLIVGSGKNLFTPKANTTRAQAAAVIEKLVNLLEKENIEGTDQPSRKVVILPSAEFKEDSLKMKLSIINQSKNPVTFTHSSGMKYDFVLLDSDKKEIYRWSADKFFTMMVTNSVIEAGKSIEYNETLSGDVYKEIKDKIVYLKAYVIGSSDAFTINSEGYEIKIK